MKLPICVEKQQSPSFSPKTVEEDRLAGRSGCTLDALDAYLDDVIAQV